MSIPGEQVPSGMGTDRCKEGKQNSSKEEICKKSSSSHGTEIERQTFKIIIILKGLNMVDVIDLTKIGADQIKVDGIAQVQPVAHSTLTMGESPVYRQRNLPWEGISTDVRGITHIESALNKAGLNWKVGQEAIYRKDGKLIANRVANVRMDTDEFIEVVSPIYKPFQNSQAFAFLEGVLGTGAMQIETAGSFGFDSVYIEARTEGIQVLGDTIVPYALIRNSHDGTSSVKVCLTPTRIVCQNTLTLALKTAKRIWTARHLRGIEDRMKEAQNMLGIIAEYTHEFPIVAEKMADINLSEKEIVSVLEKMFPGANKPETGIRTQNSIKNTVHEIMTIYLKTPDLAQHKGTAWGFYNAVADFTTHHEPKETPLWKEHRLERIADGHPLLETAQRALMAIPA
jgi:phage/plasmid-like protein (TIGR03299 family)